MVALLTAAAHGRVLSGSPHLTLTTGPPTAVRHGESQLLLPIDNVSSAAKAALLMHGSPEACLNGTPGSDSLTLCIFAVLPQPSQMNVARVQSGLPT